MKNRILYILIIALFTTSCSKKATYNNIITDPDIQQEILYGYCNRDGLKLPQFKQWFETNYNDYQPNDSIVELIKQKLPQDLTIKIVMATWCPDSRREVPRFYKIIDKIGLSEENITLICVNRKKQADNVKNLNKLEIKRVPTIIFYKNSNEIGRIVETPETTLEEDMLVIIQ